ncbi:MAG: class I SAM-dependent methyltransferase [Nitrososphaerales archaeon]|nr:class I SAM-dependent methyltransferase [Nitrososphaerales archaeon]
MTPEPQKEVPWYFDEQITRTYESWYDGKYKEADLEEKTLLNRAVQWIGGVRSLLEVGCGTAHFTRWFAATGLECCGADISPLMLNEARRLWRADRLVRAAAPLIPLRDQSVDVVAFITCFEYMKRPVDVVREARRVARAGVVFGLMNAWSVPTARRKVQILFGKNPFYKTAHFYSLREIKQVIAEAVGQGNCAIFQRSGVFPKIVPLEQSRIPLGAFLCVALRLRN